MLSFVFHCQAFRGRDAASSVADSPFGHTRPAAPRRSHDRPHPRRDLVILAHLPKRPVRRVRAASDVPCPCRAAAGAQRQRRRSRVHPGSRRQRHAARHDKSSPIYGMPILDVDKAHTVMVIKRSMNTGFAGIDNLPVPILAPFQHVPRHLVRAPSARSFLHRRRRLLARTRADDSTVPLGVTVASSSINQQIGVR